MPGPALANAPPARLGGLSAKPQRTREITLAVAAGTTFVAFLDVTVVNIAFPDLRRDFAGSSLATLSWVVTGYGVAFAALLTPAGRLADILGRRTVFLGGIAGFALASLLSALAPSVETLVAARVLQGAAAAAMIPAALGLVLAVSDPDRLSEAVGVWAASASIATAVGPTIGGLLIDSFGWRAVFLINVPIGIAAAYVALRHVPKIEGRERRLPDLAGTVVLALGLVLLAVALSKAAEWGWGSRDTIAGLLIGSALLAVALVRARKHPAPAIDTALWQNRLFAVANAASLAFGAVMYVWLLLGVLFITAVWNYSVLEAGLAVSPGAFTAAAASVVTGRVALPRQRYVVGGSLLAMVGVAVWLYLALSPDPQFVTLWLPAGLISGAAMGAAATGIASVAVASVAPARFAAGVGLNLTARQVGGALGIAALATVLETGAPGVEAYRDAYLLSAAVALLAAGLVVRGMTGRAGELPASSPSGPPSGSAAGLPASSDARPATGRARS